MTRVDSGKKLSASARFVRQLVEQVEYDPETDKVEIRFKPGGFRLIAEEKGT